MPTDAVQVNRDYSDGVCWCACSGLTGTLQQPDELDDRQRFATPGRVDAGGQQPAGRLVTRSRPLRKAFLDVLRRCAKAMSMSSEPDPETLLGGPR